MVVRDDLIEIITQVMVDHGFDDDDSCIKDVIIATLSYLGVDEEIDDGDFDSRLADKERFIVYADA